MSENVINLEILENIDREINNHNPVNVINDKEFDIIINNLATYIILTTNKNLNPTGLFITIASDRNIEKLCKKLTGYDNLISILKMILNRHPNLVKSIKLKKKTIKQLKNKK